jgi:hypothetical protein
MGRRRQQPRWPGHATVAEAVRFLASACDGAVRRDGHGFSADHVQLGHWLAALPDEQWVAWHHHQGCQLVTIYRRQLGYAGFDSGAILRGAPPRRARRREARDLRPMWVSDPTGLWHFRWWNGARWTHFVSGSGSRELAQDGDGLHESAVLEA